MDKKYDFNAKKRLVGMHLAHVANFEEYIHQQAAHILQNIPWIKNTKYKTYRIHILSIIKLL